MRARFVNESPIDEEADKPKPKKRRRQKWTQDDKDTRVRSFSGGYEKSVWRGANPTDK